MNYAPCLVAIHGEHVRAAARSIGAALTEQPLLLCWKQFVAVVRNTQRWDEGSGFLIRGA